MVTALSVLLLTGCNASDEPGAGEIIGTDTVSGSPQPIPDLKPVTAGHIRLALRYVVYTDGAGEPVVTEAEARNNVTEINALWSTCNLSFQIDEFLAVDPARYGFVYNTSSKDQLTNIRNEFENDRTLLVVTTGTWSGSLGALSTNAWTMMPGTSTNGVVMEATVAKSPRLIAHELGHYLNLGHLSDTSNMMNPVIYASSTALSTSQCNAARSAASHYWSAMYR
jgi:hypothetical protein